MHGDARAALDLPVPARGHIAEDVQQDVVAGAHTADGAYCLDTALRLEGRTDEEHAQRPGVSPRRAGGARADRRQHHRSLPPETVGCLRSQRRLESSPGRLRPGQQMATALRAQSLEEPVAGPRAAPRGPLVKTEDFDALEVDHVGSIRAHQHLRAVDQRAAGRRLERPPSYVPRPGEATDREPLRGVASPTQTRSLERDTARRCRIATGVGSAVCKSRWSGVELLIEEGMPEASYRSEERR